MDAELQSITALPGAGRYQLGFRSADGSIGTAVVEVEGEGLRVADAALPPPWRGPTEARAAITAAVLAFVRARTAGAPLSTLCDVPGGWDVSIGNVVLADGAPSCVAHGPMTADGSAFRCETCGARAVLGPGSANNVVAGG